MTKMKNNVLFLAAVACCIMSVCAASAGTVLRFAVISDGHYGESDSVNRDNGAIVRYLNEHEDSNGKHLDYVFHDGDVTNDIPGSSSDVWQAVKDTLDMLKAPYFCARGNHDMGPSDAQWESLWGYPPKHDFEQGEYAFVFDDTRNHECPDPSWLIDRLDHYAGKKQVFVFTHIGLKGLSTYSISCPAMTKVLEEHLNVAAVFHGHDHDPSLGCKLSNGLNYCWVGAIKVRPYYRIVEVDDSGKVYTYQFDSKTSTILDSNTLKHENPVNLNLANDYTHINDSRNFDAGHGVSKLWDGNTTDFMNGAGVTGYE